MSRPSIPAADQLLAVLRDPERCEREVSELVAERALPSEAWPWILRHAPFGSWIRQVAKTSAPPIDPIVWEHVVRHLREGPEHTTALEAAICAVTHPELVAELWRELRHHDPERAARLLPDIPRAQRVHLTMGDIDAARVLGRVPHATARELRVEAAQGPAGPRASRWRPLVLTGRTLPPVIRTLRDAEEWVTTAERAEQVIGAIDTYDHREWLIEQSGSWPREALTEAVVTAMISTSTRAGRTLLARASEAHDIELASWVLSWCLDAWRGWHSLANHQVENLAVELTGDALAMVPVPPGGRLWRELREVATMRGSSAAKELALWVVLCYSAVDAGDLAWLESAKERLYDEWATALVSHPLRFPGRAT